MGVPAAFDATKHHIGLGVDTANLKGYFTVGAYSKQLANPVFSKPSDIGTDDLVGLRSLSNWTQDDFSGGEFQPDWADDSMFDECVGMLPDQLSRRIRTIRPMDTYLVSETQADITPVDLAHISGFLFLVFNNVNPQGKVHRYNPANPASSPQKETVDTTYLPAGKLITAARWNEATNRLWIGSNRPQIDTFDWDSAAAAGSRMVHVNTYQTPTSCTAVSGIHIFGKLKVIVCRNRNAATDRALLEDDSLVFLYVSGSGSSTKWTPIGNLPGDYVASVTYNNAVYILSRKENTRTFVSMTQGSQVFPVLELPYFFRGQSMVEYAGRLYIGGVGFDLDGNDHHGELYELNGASLRLVRTFAPFVNDPTPANEAATMASTSPGTKPVKRQRTMTKMKAMCVAEGLLWMPDSSYLGLEAYDATTDAFYGGPRARHGHDSTIDFTNFIPYGDSIYAWGRGPTAGKTGFWRTERKADTGEIYQPYLITSDFHPEPARDKMWSRLVVHSQYSSPGPVQYSFDSGESWNALPAPTITTVGNRRISEYDLSGVPASKQIRFKFVYAKSGTANESCTYHVAHSLSFLVRGDTKKRWSFTILDAEYVEDNTLDTNGQVTTDVATALWALKDATSPISFRDVDRTDYKVVITDLTDSHAPVDPQGERFIQVALLEV